MNKVGIGIIGCGNISDAYLKAAAGFSLLDIRGLADIRPQAAQAAVSTHRRLAIWIFMLRQMQSGGNKALSFGKSRAKLLTETQGKVTFEDVAGVARRRPELHQPRDMHHGFRRFGRQEHGVERRQSFATHPRELTEQFACRPQNPRTTLVRCRARMSGAAPVDPPTDRSPSR